MPTTLYRGKYLALLKEGCWEYAHRVNVSGAVIVVAVTANQKLLLVEQYRIPVQARTLELPAGIIGDEPDSTAESPVDAARRELLEETGYACEQFEVLMAGPLSAGATSEVATFVRATCLSRVHDGGGVAHEDITVHEMPLAEADQWLAAKARDGILIDPKIYAGLYFSQR